jgi:hypothetical protein
MASPVERKKLKRARHNRYQRLAEEILGREWEE